MKRIGIDVGGTFTDFMVYDTQTSEYEVRKVPSTPENPALALLSGLTEDGIDLAEVAQLAHGTTVTTNAVIQKKWARAGLLTTEGFRDILEFRRTQRGSQYDIQWDPPRPLIERRHRLEVRERIDYKGSVVLPLDERQAVAAAAQLVDAGMEGIAICFLNSYVNATHEQRVKELILERWPHLFVTASSEILPEWREFERTSTAVVNAYVGPILKRYLDYLGDRLRREGYDRDVFVMLSNGGLSTGRIASEVAAQTLKSGPSAGAIAQLAITSAAGVENSVGLDMGGTSADVAVITGGRVGNANVQEIEFGTVVAMPTVDITSIGAGGGSIAWIDSGNALRVGPQSAGAVPGPVCYRKGGTWATVTDANLVLGRLGRRSLIGGRLELDGAAAYGAIEEQVAQPFGMSIPDAAWGILRIAIHHMANAIRLLTVERGLDPRGYTLFPYGGAGPMHAGPVARELGMRDILVPPHPGATSAVGLLMADIRHDFVQTVLQRSDLLDATEMEGIFVSLEERARARLMEEGLPSDRIRIRRRADLRYWGQTHDLTVDVPEGSIGQELVATVRGQFDREHLRQYGHVERANHPVEFVNLRVVGEGIMDRVPLSPRRAGSSLEKALMERRPVYFEGVGFVDTPIYQKDLLPTGKWLFGPAIIEQFDSTLVIAPDERVQVDEFDNARIQL